MATVAGYDAFISYSHQHDRTLGPALQASLERFAKPWRKLRMSRIFIDKVNLAASPELWGSVEKELAASRWFILLASDDAAKSYWVDREVRWWLEYRSLDRLLIVATSPGMAWDKAKEDWAGTAPVPAALRGAFPGEPFWVDLSDLPPGARGSQVPDDKVADVAAPVRGVPKDTLVGEHLRQHRRTLRLARTTIAVLAILTGLAVTASVIAARAARASDIAAQAAVSGELAAQSKVVAATNPVQAAQLAVASWRLAPTAQARALARISLLDVVAQPDRGAFATPGDSGSAPYHSVVFSPHGKVLATASYDGTARLWGAATHRQIGTPMTADSKPVLAVAFSPDGTMLATASEDGTARLWDVATHRQIGTPMTTDDQAVREVAFSPDGTMLAVGYSNGRTQLWNVASRKLIATLTDPGPAAGYSVAFSPDGTLLAVGNIFEINSNSNGGNIYLWNVSTRQMIATLTDAGSQGVGSVAFSPGGTLLAAGDSNGRTYLWNVSSRKPVATLTDSGSQGVDSVAFSPGGTLLAAGDSNGSTYVWNVSSRKPVATLTDPGGDASVDSVAFSPDGTLLAAADNDNSAYLWSLATRKRTATFTDPDGSHADSVRFSPDGKILAVGDTYGNTYLWNVP
jgi:WD40 repeat protein